MTELTGLEAFAPVLQQLRARSHSYFGARDVVLEPTEYFKRRRSQLIRVRARLGTRETYVFLKKYYTAQAMTPERLERLRDRLLRDFAAATRIYQRLPAQPGLRAVRPIACFPDELTIVSEEARGEILGVVLDRRARWYPSPRTLDELCTTLGRIGTWLRIVHAIHPSPGRFSLDDMRTYLDVRLRRIAQAGALSERQRARVLRYFDSRRADVPESELVEVSIHADLCPGNVLVDGTNITVLDFTMARTGAIYHDLAHMFMHLTFRTVKPSFRPPVMERLLRATLEGFDPGLGPDRTLFRLLCVQHLLCQLAKLATRPVTNPARRAYRWYVWQRYVRWLDMLTAED